MGKVVFWAVVIVVALLIARVLARQATKSTLASKQPKQAPPRVPPTKPQHPESMVRCAHCGIHMPRSEAVLMDGKTWCSQEHARLGVRQ